jgi:mycobactin polyketide synthetase MbtD
LDSLLALDLRRRLRRAVGHSAPVAQMLGGITVSELIDVLGLGCASGSAVARTPERLDSTRD